MLIDCHFRLLPQPIDTADTADIDTSIEDCFSSSILLTLLLRRASSLSPDRD